MKINLKNNMAYFTRLGLLERKDVKVELDLPAFNFTDYKVSVKLNNSASRLVKKTFTISYELLKKAKTLKVDVIIINRKTAERHTFLMDPININQAILLGDGIYDLYPVSLKTIQDDMQTMKKRMDLMSKSIVQIGKKGEIL